MISVEEAKELVVNNAFQLPAVNKNIDEAIHFVLSETITSPISYPPFNQSAMDGFAFRFADFQRSIPLNIIGESAAGAPFAGVIKEGQSVLILTGAKVPADADTVVTLENASFEGENLIVNHKQLKHGSNIRHAGSHIKQGEIILTKGHVVNPATIGFLASLGIISVKVFPNPRITIIITGNELVKPGSSLHDGQIFESNSYSIKAALQSIHIRKAEIFFVNDDEKQTIAKLRTAISKSDIVLTTGGISAGKYDFVGKALEQLGVKTIFYKVSQKPGKPLFFGKINAWEPLRNKEVRGIQVRKSGLPSRQSGFEDAVQRSAHNLCADQRRNSKFLEVPACLVFALPGNPAAFLTAFYEYAYPVIRTMQGHQNIFLKKEMLPIANAFSKKDGLALFLKGKTADGKVHVLQGQDSNNISSFVNADCLIYLTAAKGNVTEGEQVEIHLLPV